MAIYHFSAKVISRANGSSALAAAAYRSASRLHDDAQLAREVEFAIPRELDQQQGIELARDFVEREFVERGMVADLNVHWDIGADGEPKPHAHVMLTMREVNEQGLGAKVRDWNRTDLLNHWREAWADHANQRLAELDIDARVDHRSLEAQGIDLEPQHKIGPAAARMAADGLDRERVDEHREIARANGDKLLAKPNLALGAITRQQATFTNRDLAMFVHRHSDGKDQFDCVMAAVKAAPDLIALGKDGRGNERFTSRDMIETEQRLERAAERLAGREEHSLPAAATGGPIATAERSGLALGEDQRAALEHITRGRDIALVVGYAGTGKSAMLGVAREAWEQAGYRVQGLALSGIAAENLENGSGIASCTIASLEHQWGQGRELLSANDVLVIDEAGMIGSRQMERVVSEAEKHGAKIVLVGDTEQLQAIEAGAAFRSLAERHGAVEITEIRRQREDWQRDATRRLATGRTSEAIGAYAGHDMVHQTETRDDARGELIARWDRERQAAPDASRIILTHTNENVQALNDAARERMRAGGELADDIAVHVERGARSFAGGDRIMFLRNERSIGVKNGSLGTIQSITSARMAVTLDDGRAVAFDTKDYAAVDHGYAATIHKAQGMTVDRTHVLATPGLDRHGSYVALSRHRDGVQLHYGRDDFADQGKLVRTLSRERVKDMASDYTRDFAERRGIGWRERAVEFARAVPERVRGMFDGLNLGGRPSSHPERGMFDGLKLDARPTAPERTPLDRAAERFARAAAEIVAARRDGGEELPHQRAQFTSARKALDAIKPEAGRDMREAFARDPALIDAAAKGRTTQAIRAMMIEAEVRTDPAKRADRFIGDWSKLAEKERSFRHDYDERAVARVRSDMGVMAKRLERDPQIESLVRQRLPEIGIRIEKGASLSHDLQKWLSRSRDIGLSL